MDQTSPPSSAVHPRRGSRPARTRLRSHRAPSSHGEVADGKRRQFGRGSVWCLDAREPILLRADRVVLRVCGRSNGYLGALPAIYKSRPPSRTRTFRCSSSHGASSGRRVALGSSHIATRRRFGATTKIRRMRTGKMQRRFSNESTRLDSLRFDHRMASSDLVAALPLDEQ